MTQLMAHTEFRWLTPAEGGRKTPFLGPRYATTARFAGESELFSVVMFFSSPAQANPSEGDLALLHPDRIEIQKRFVPGCQLEITEGPKLVAQCRVVSSAVCP